MDTRKDLQSNVDISDPSEYVGCLVLVVSNAARREIVPLEAQEQEFVEMRIVRAEVGSEIACPDHSLRFDRNRKGSVCLTGTIVSDSPVRHGRVFRFCLAKESCLYILPKND